MIKQFFIYALFLTLVACSSIPLFKPATPAEAVKERAQMRWDALLKGEKELAYQFETPGYKSTHTITQYQKRYGLGVKWIKAEIKSVTVEDQDQVATVDVSLTYEVDAIGDGAQSSTLLKEKWLLIDEEWYFFYPG